MILLIVIIILLIFVIYLILRPSKESFYEPSRCGVERCDISRYNEKLYDDDPTTRPPVVMKKPPFNIPHYS